METTQSAMTMILCGFSLNCSPNKQQISIENQRVDRLKIELWKKLDETFAELNQLANRAKKWLGFIART